MLLASRSTTLVVFWPRIADPRTFFGALKEMIMRVLAVLALGVSGVQAQSQVLITGMQCTSTNDWINGGGQTFTVAECETACAGSTFFQRQDGSDSNCRCCDSNVNDNLVGQIGGGPTPDSISPDQNANIYRNALVASQPGPEELIEGAECATNQGWLNLGDRSVENCAAECTAAGYPLVQRMSLGGGDNNCKCCDQALNSGMVLPWEPGHGAMQSVLFRINPDADACGVYGGDGSSCAGCDGVSNSGVVDDACGVCDGDGSSCAGCDGVSNSGAVDDACGVCDGDGSSCAGSGTSPAPPSTGTSSTGTSSTTSAPASSAPASPPLRKVGGGLACKNTSNR